MDKAFEFLMENVPVAVAMIVMTKLFLTYLKTRDESALSTRREATEAINRNTEVLAELKTLIGEMGKEIRHSAAKGA